MVSQDKCLVEQYVRQSEDIWLLIVHSAPDSAVEPRAAGAALALADVDEGIDFGGE